MFQDVWKGLWSGQNDLCNLRDSDRRKEKLDIQGREVCI